MSQRKNKTANLIAAGIVAALVLILLVATESNDKKSQLQNSTMHDSTGALEKGINKPTSTGKPSVTNAAQQQNVTSGSSQLESEIIEQAKKPSFQKPTVPNELPEEMKQQLTNPPPELPEDLKAQLNAPPAELPEDLKRQLNAPPPDLPPDLKAQLEAPPPEIPEDIKRALATPPRVVSLDEVNNPAPHSPE